MERHSQQPPDSQAPLGGPPASFSGRDVAMCSTEEARAMLPFVEASGMQVLPLALLRGTRGAILHCAVGEDSDSLRDRVRFASGLEVSLAIVPREVLEDAIIRAYLGSDQRLEASIAKLAGECCAPAEPARQPNVPESDAAKFLAALLEYGAARGASDLHLCPVRGGAIVKMRIDGELLSQEERPYPLPLHERVLCRIKALASLDVTERRIPQDGAFSFMVGDSERAARVSTLPAVHGESLVVRFLHGRAIPSVSMLGLEPATAAVLRAAMRRTSGVILCTGPTGSGKTTTMYAVVQDLRGSGRNVVTVEDPVETSIRGLVQVQVNEAHGLSYPRAIRSVLRHDPDVILIGEMRDLESASIGLEAASTGHLTISSLHVGSALLALGRLSSLGVPHERSVHAVSVVVSQRLLGKLCPRCRIVDESHSERFGCMVYAPRGCDACGGSGFSGRVLATELLDLQGQRAKAVCLDHRSQEALMENLPSAVLIPWTVSLQSLMLQGLISAAQFEAFIDTEMAPP